MVSFGVSTQWPADLQGNVDAHQTFRRSVGRQMRRDMERLANEAASQYDEAGMHGIANSFEVHQGSGDEELTIALVNTKDTFIWGEVDTAPHFPWPLDRLEGWTDQKIGDPSATWAIAMKIAKEGTKGTYIVTHLWSELADGFVDNAADAAGRWAARFGAVEV